MRTTSLIGGLPGSLSGKESACNAGEAGSIPGSVRSSGEGASKPLQYSCLENPMDRGAWSVTVHEVAKSQTRLAANRYTRLPIQTYTQHLLNMDELCLS